MSTAEGSIGSTGSAPLPTAVIGVLREALLALGAAGRPVEANRLAARAWSSLRGDSPEHAETINRTMHVLARLETEHPPGSVGPPAACPPVSDPPTDHQGGNP